MNIFRACSLVRLAVTSWGPLFSCQKPDLLDGSVELFLLLLRQGRHERLKVLCMPLEARCCQTLSLRSQVNDASSSIRWARLANNQPWFIEADDRSGH